MPLPSPQAAWLPSRRGSRREPPSPVAARLGDCCCCGGGDARHHRPSHPLALKPCRRVKIAPQACREPIGCTGRFCFCSKLHCFVFCHQVSLQTGSPGKSAWHVSGWRGQQLKHLLRKSPWSRLSRPRQNNDVPCASADSNTRLTRTSAIHRLRLRS